MQLSDRITGGALVLLGAAAAWGGSKLPAVPGQDVGPAAFPMLIGFGLIFCGSLIAFGVGRSFEVEEEPQENSGSLMARLGLRVLVPPALLLFYALAVDHLGFLLTAGVMVFLGALALRASVKLALPLAIIAPFFVHLAFYRLLRVPLPEGLLGAPW
ncbi:tripartite tricarboxylate transporter TctB family protein [Roseococcus pinisoli]|uniref:Tripartite tricarboxylate transporter TctB family protein n=1 Tax=Roseococcus pinisoli TaxID=2835040 RepID=A0ABS5QIW5_9PROT|nr:tripartite tricarboxylate transporter TctB family protein [Roseococcus pinisoli]